MKILNIVQSLVELSPRFGPGEEATAKFIRKFLQDNKVPFIDQTFQTTVPMPKKAELLVDGESIECRNVGLESGVISNKDYIITSLMWGPNDFYYPANINFNPRCEDTVSMATYYKHTALSVRRDDIPKIIAAQEVRGETIVEPYTFEGHNFLIGNTTNPKTIIFTHYDCWEKGAIDNASGTAVTMHVVMNHPELFQDNLFVIAGNEEISYDEPIYWGKGYRAFQEEYNHVVESAEKINVIDCVGYSEHDFSTEPDHVSLGLPLSNFEKYSSKCSMLCGSFDGLLKVYHSDDDTPELLSEESLLDAEIMLIEYLKK